MAILKAVSVKIDADTVALLTFMYHTETKTGPDNIEKTDRSKSQYRYEGRIAKIADLEAEMAKMKAAPTDPWKWPGLDAWRCSYDSDATNARGAKWIASKLKKAVDWPTGKKILDGWKASKNDYKDNRKYDQTGYTADGQPFDITLESLIKLGPGKTFSKPLTPKKKA